MLIRALVEIDSTMSEAYWSGFFDGDGYLGVSRNNGGYYVMISVAQKNPAVLLPLQAFAGGGICVNSRGYHVWSTTGENAVKFLNVILPHSRMKRPQIEVALAFHNARSDVHGELADTELRELKRHYRDVTVQDASTEWLAGFFDAEGSVRIAKQPQVGRRTAYCFKSILSVSQNNRQVLDALVRKYGGSISEDSRGNCFKYSLSDRMVVPFIEDVLPMLVAKRQEAETVLAFQKRKRNPGRAGYSAEEWQANERDYEALRNAG